MIHTPRDTTSAARPQALVIGAGPVLGAALAQRFGREGYAVTVAGRNQGRLDELAASLRDAGIAADSLVADAGNAAGFQGALQDYARRATPEVVIYNAALMAGDDLLTSTPQYLQDAYAVNVLGAVAAAQTFAPGMRRAGSGTILVTGGGLGLAPDPGFATMSMGKAALRAAATMLHQQLSADGVHVATVIITGNIAAGTSFDPDLIAETYWTLHAQPSTEWTAEAVFDGR